MRAARSLHNISNLTSSQNYYISKSWNPSLSPLSPTKGAPQFFIAFLIGLGGESFFAAVRRGANLYFFTTGHHFYNRKPRNKYILLYSTLYSTTSILLQKSLNLTPIQGFLGRWLQAALLRFFAFSSPGERSLWSRLLADTAVLSYSKGIHHFCPA